MHARRATPHRHATPARSRERGAALVEMTVAVPFLVLLVFGIVEWGWAYRDAMTLTGMTRSGARVGAGMGNDPSADWQILQAVRGSSNDVERFEAVVVYRSTATDGKVPSGCLSQPVAGVCNLYTGADLTLSEGAFLAAAYTKDDSWPAVSRRVDGTSSDNSDHLGVYVRVRSDSPIGVLFRSRPVSESTVMQLSGTMQYSATP